MKAFLEGYRLAVMKGRARSNCLVYALVLKLIYGREVVIRIRQSPSFPLLPRVAYSFTKGRAWSRFMHHETPRNDGWRRWLPIHAVWFHGAAKRDI